MVNSSGKTCNEHLCYDCKTGIRLITFGSFMFAVSYVALRKMCKRAHKESTGRKKNGNEEAKRSERTNGCVL